MTGPFKTAVVNGVILLSGLGPDTWGMTISDARKLRDALTLALALATPGADEPSLPCRITKGRKACRSCGAASGQAHSSACPETLQPREGERRVGPLERRAGVAALTDLLGNQRSVTAPGGARYSELTDGLVKRGVMVRSGAGPGGPDIVGYAPGVGYFERDVAAPLDLSGVRCMPGDYDRAELSPDELKVLRAKVTVEEKLEALRAQAATEEKLEPQAAPRLVACDECFRYPPSHLSSCSKR